MNYLTREVRLRIVGALVEGCSIRATARMTGVSKDTVMKLMVELGEVCDAYQHQALRGLSCKRVQVDEIWAFVHAKAKNAKPEMKAAGEAGDIWTWTALDADSKLIVCWLVGGRDAGYAYEIMQDLAHRLTSRVQLTTDGHKAYLSAVEDAFGSTVDYAQLVKIYGKAEGADNERRYSPAVCTGTETNVISGRPDPEHISTSYVERQNLTIRMSLRRFTRLTNAFSKKVRNHAAALALHFMNYNFCRVHQTLKVTPAMEANVTNHVWELSEVLDLLEAAEQARETALGPRRTRKK